METKIHKTSFENYKTFHNKDEKRTRPESPALSNGNMTFISGTGVFDWAQSRLMSDVVNKRVKFNIDDPSIYTEEEIYSKIE